jgi:hypothetical protein
MNCPGSIALCESVPQLPTSRYALEGTVAHDLAEQCLRTKAHPGAFLGKAFQGVPVTLDMRDAIVTYLNEIETEMARSAGLCTVFIEQAFTLDLDGCEPDEVGSINDCVIFHPATGRLRVFEYKHGAGVFVDVEDNKQLKFAALGAVMKNPQWRVTEIVCTVVQPRARDTDEPVRNWQFDLLELLEFRVELEAAIKAAKTPGADIQAGSHCRWCDAAAVCPAKQAQALQAATVDFADITLVTADALPAPKDLDTERLAKVVAGVNVLSAWASQCQEYLEGLVLSGVAVPGWKAVEKIGRAKWVDDPAKVASYASLMFDLDEDQVMPRKLATIGDVEKQLKAAGASKDQIDAFKLQFTIKESSGLTIAPDSDRRPAINAAQDNFGAVSIQGK